MYIVSKDRRYNRKKKLVKDKYALSKVYSSQPSRYSWEKKPNVVPWVEANNINNIKYFEAEF